MRASIATSLRSVLFLAAIVASVATSLATAWELTEQSEVMPIELAAGEVLEFELVVHGNQAAFAQAKRNPDAGNASFIAALTADGDAPAELMLQATLSHGDITSTATLAPGESTELRRGDTWEPTESCSLTEANSEQGCTIHFRVTLSAVGGAASGTLQATVDLSGPEGDPDEHAAGELWVELVPVVR